MLFHNKFCQLVFPLSSKFIAGDFSTKHPQWESRLYNHNRQKSNLDTISTAIPTYWPTDANKVQNVLGDRFITKEIGNNYINISSSYDLSSDQSPVIATISSQLLQSNLFANI